MNSRAPWIVVTVIAVAALAAGGAVRAADPTPADVKVSVSAPIPAAPGGHSEVIVTFTIPEGIKINRFPPIKLTLTAAEPVSLDKAEWRQGSDQPIEKVEDFPFKTVEPMSAGFGVAPGAAPGKYPVSGKIRFITCIQKTGSCTQTARDIAFEATVTPPRAN